MNHKKLKFEKQIILQNKIINNKEGHSQDNI